ncbi:FUSC family membrane protein [Chitinophaga sp. XS-30]|uniref:FUSC family protein n=1 Tax=Chitinophaga sp. XS-30 TaxID=2604421 RepID=UPI0011DD4A71|nr:FUSC family membrane protein [Chitinophaga sp. XS-30]QEH42079.1 hypothetical protein FW415_14830 [Chitinophaga sp. XS-30]
MQDRWFKEAKAFIFSYHFSTGLRTTLSVVVPSVIFAQIGRLDMGISISMGALCTALADVPGTILHKRNGLLISTVLIFLTALGTGLLQPYIPLLTIWIGLCSVFYSMLLIYGNRGGNIGIGGLLVMVSVLAENYTARGAVQMAVLTLSGSIWYSLLALLLWQIRPYLTVQQTLGDCIQSTARYLRMRADFYLPDKDLTATYREVFAQQVVVNEKQEAVRELLLKMRSAQQGTTSISKSMVLIFLDLVDMHEQIMASQMDYTSLQKQFGKTQMVAQLHHAILQFAEELDNIGVAVTASQRSLPKVNLKFELEKARREFKAYQAGLPTLKERAALLPFETVIDNMQHIAQRIYNLHRLTRLERVKETTFDHQLELSRFTTRHQYDLATFRNNLTFNSHIFRHAIRTGLAMVCGLLLGLALDLSKTYWILLTIMVIMKPGFSLTKTRSFQRVIGTLIGAFFAAGILWLTKDDTIIFSVMLICILGAYSFNTYNYVVSVVFMTPFIVFLLHFLQPADFQNLTHRVIDTLIGCGIAFSFNYFFWPSWEYRFLPDYMVKTIASNKQYLTQVINLYTNKPFSLIAYKLARKDVHVNTANLTAAFQRMLSEPKSKQKHASELYHFVVLSHTLSSHIAQLSAFALQHGMRHKRQEYKDILLFLLTVMDQIEQYVREGVIFPELQPTPAFQQLEDHLEQLLQVRQQQINEGQGNTPEREEMLEIKHVRDQFNALYSVLKDMKKAAVHGAVIAEG